MVFKRGELAHAKLDFLWLSVAPRQHARLRCQLNILYLPNDNASSLEQIPDSTLLIFRLICTSYMHERFSFLQKAEIEKKNILL